MKPNKQKGEKLKFDIWKTANPVRAKGYRQAFPSRFLLYFKRDFVKENDKVLSLFSGYSEEFDTVDINPESKAKIIGDALKLDFKGEYDVILADPPYNEQFAKEWNVPYPKPFDIMRACNQYVKRGGIVALLHILIVPPPKDTDLVRTHIIAIPTGSHNAIRVLNVYKKS